jgi:hypothetical protein
MTNITPDVAPVPVDADNPFGPLTITLDRKPKPGITVGQVPPVLARALAENAPKALVDPDFELTLTARDEKTAKLMAGYARAWGAQQTPKLYIHKVPNRRDMPANVARLAVELDESVPPENRPGRKVK